MKRKLRSCLAVVLTFATVATSIPTSAFAADLETETNTEVTTEAVSESQVATEGVATQTDPSSEDSTVETQKEETEAKVETETAGSVESTEAKETKDETKATEATEGTEATEKATEATVETETEATTVAETETETETEEIKGLVKITVSEGGKVVLKDANGSTIREVAYADTAVEPVKYEAKEGTVVKIEVIANGEKNFEVGTYKNTLDSGAVTEETHVPEGTERIERTITLSRNTQNINVVFDEVEVETESESKTETETESETESETQGTTETETETVVEMETETETVVETETETETETVVETETETETAVVETEVETEAEETEEVQYTNFTVKGNGTVSIHVNGKQTAIVSSEQTVGVKSELLKSGDITAVMMPDDEENLPYRVKWNGAVVDEDCFGAVDDNGDYTYYIFEPSGDFEFEFITYEEASFLVKPYGDGSLLDGGWLKKLLDNAQDGTTYKNMKVGTKYSTKSTFVSQLNVHSSYASQGGYVEVQDTTTDFANTFGTRFWMTTCGSSTANPCPSVGDTGTLYAYIASRTSDSVEVRVAFINDNGYHQNVYCNYTLTIPDSQKVSIVIQKRLANSDRADTHLYTLDATFKVINDSTKKEVGRITTDSKTGIGTLELDNITKKTSFTIKEVKAPKYATIKSASMNCTVAPGESAKVVCTDYPYFGIVYVNKVFTDKKYHSFLNGCVFGIWDNPKCEGKPLETATVSSSKTKINRWLAFGRWYYIKEISVPKDSGLVLSEKITKVRFTEDDLPTVTLKDQDSDRIIPKSITCKNDKPGPVKVRVRKTSNLYGAELPWLDKYPTLYSLKGAEFTFYWDKACTDEIGVVHTNIKSTQTPGAYVSEWLNVPGLDAGESKTIYCVETDPPAGHVAHSVNGSPEVYHVKVTAPTDANKTALFAVEASDPYLHASFAGILQKVDKTTKKPLAGAKFKLTLRDSLGGNVLETWTYKTEQDGTITFGKPLSGPAYISSKSGLTWFPVGYYEFEEIEAPVVDGVQYTRDPEILSFDVGMSEETRKADGSAKIHKEWEWSTQRDNTSTSPVSLKKVSSNPSITDNNSMYSVEGAKFVLTKTDGTASYTFTCKADGTTDAQDVLVGTYTVQETYAPKGYKKNNNIPNITVQSGVKGTQTFTVSDEPEVKTVNVAVQKTTKGASSAGRDYSDARFKIEYFDNETSTGTPKRTWVFAAGKNGSVDLDDEDSLVSGDVLWVIGGHTVFPLGSVRITETVAPKGLVKDSTPKSFPLTENNSVTFETVTFVDDYIFGGVKLSKYTESLNSKSAFGDATLGGAVFGIYNASGTEKVLASNTDNLIANGGLMTKITTDNNGVAQCDAILEAGTYTVKEISAPEGYQKNEGFSYSFTITENGQIVDATGVNALGTVPEPDVTGGLKVQKAIKDGEGQGDAKLSGAQFAVTNKSANPVKVNGTIYHVGEVVMTLTTNEEGKAETGANVLPYGTYEVKETVAPEGCDKDDTVQTVKIRTQGQYDTVPYTWQEPIVRGNIEVLKYDYDRNEEALKQGDAVLTGAEFEIYNKSANAITYVTDNGATKKTVDPNGLIDTIKTDEKGIATTEPNSLPYGTYFVTEVKAPDGYTQEGENLSFTLNIRESGKTYNGTARNRVVRGGLSIAKVDSDIDTAQGGATLEGAEFSIINRSADAVKVNGQMFDPGQTVMKIYTDKDGKASTGEKDLPYGTYEVKETGNPTGYHVDAKTSTVKIQEEGKIVASEYTFVEKVYRGDFDIKKVDKDANIGEFAQGDATLEGAVFNIVSLNEQPVKVDGEVYNKGDVVKTITTDEKGHAWTEGKTFPYGLYYYEEIESPEGYLLSGVRLSGNFTIDVDGEVETRSYESNNGPMDDVIRGGFELAKVDNDSNSAYAQGDASLEGAEFTLYNRSINAVYVDVDNDGIAERYEAGAVITRYYTDANGKIVVSGRVLPYGRYELVETGSSEGYQLDGSNLRQPFSIEKDGQMVNLTGEKATTEKVQLFGFKGGKWDLELNAEKVIQGTASLKGATVELVNKSAHSVVVEGKTYSSNAVVHTFTTDKDGKFSIGEVLPYGTYTLNETKAPEGYALKGSKVSYTFKIVENEDKTFTAMGGYEGEELSEIPMSGHIVNLDTENSAIKDQVYRGDISLHKLEGQLSTDEPSDLLKPLEGIRFEISLVKSWTSFDKKVPDEVQFVTAIVTNKDGYASTKTLEGRNPLGYLPYGWYMIHEDPTTTPSHLTPAGDKFIYVGKYNGNYVQSMDYEGMYVNNKQTESLIKLVKKDKESGETVALAGAKFRILDDTFHVVSFRVAYPKFETLTEFTTDDNGEVSLPEKLKYGTYYLEELGAPTGYLKGEKIQFNVDTFGSFSPDDMLQVTFYDDEAHGRIKLNKTDKFTGKVVEGAVYGVYAAEDIVTPDGVKHASKGDKVDEMVTDANGYAESTDLYLNKGGVGKYIVKEIAAPLGFMLDETEYPVTVTYKDDETPIVYTSINTVNTPTVLKLYKTDIDDLKLKGITFEINRIGGSEGTGIEFADKFTGGQVITGTDGLLEVDYVPSGIYEISEIATLPGYVLDDTVRYFTVDENGKIYESDEDGNKLDADAVASDTLEMEWVNDYTKVSFSKTDVTGKKELGGAKLEVYDEDGNKVYSWTSVEGEEHRIDKVPLGHYTLRETLASDGYVIASDVEFDIVNTGVLQKVTMVDKIMEARKVDTNGKNVVGAKMEVREVVTSGTDKGEAVYSDVLDSWTTDGKAHRIKGLTVGHTYVLLETEAPEGWVLASPVTFTVNDDKEDQEISMVDIQMKANKYDETRKEYVVGAKLEVRTTKGEVVTSWTTDGSYHYISGLVAGKSYVLVETFAPDGYAIANPVNFTVYDNGTDQEVTMINKKVLVYKTNTNVTEIKGAHLEVRDADGNVVDSWVSDGTPHAIVGLKVGLTYTLVETLAPEGYAIAIPITFTVEDDAKNTKINLINKRVYMSKVDITGKNEVPGATMIVYDMGGNEVDSWVSGEQPHAIKNLVVGETYRLHEVAAPNGYVVASDFEFTVTDDKQNQTVKMTDKQLFVSKSDITGQKELVGAKLTVIEEATNKVVDSWTSTKDQHAVNGLHVNKWYILREEVAPDGYVIASDVRFFVDDDGKIQRVQMKDKQMMASKKSVTGEDELPGATLVVLDKEGNELDRWVSGDKVHAIKNLRVNETYTLREITAPNGYVIASDVEFTVLDDFQIQTVTMKDKQLFVSKKSVTGEDELEGATLYVTEKGSDKVLDKWVSEKEAHAVNNLKVGKTYVLTEETAPKGYVIASSIEFTVLDDFQIQTVTMIDKIMTAHKVSADNKYVEGAKMEVRKYHTDAEYEVLDKWTTEKDKSHDIENLRVGETYTLVEVEAPKGWVLATPVEFTVEDDKKDQNINMIDIRVSAHKYDETVEKYVEGASLEVRDDKGKVVDSWTTGKEFHYIENLIAGKSYTLVETKAPKGYAIAKPVAFTVVDNGEDQKVVMINKKVLNYKVDTKVEMLPGAELEVRDKEGNVVDKWTSDGTAHEIENLRVGETYTLVEVKAPEGYAIATQITFTVADDAKNESFNMIDKQVFVSKKTVTGQDELPGAKLKVRDKVTGEVVDSWVSGKDQHAIKNLYVGKSYELIEETAPDGYVIAESIDFTVLDDATNQFVEMKDKQLFVSKIDVTGEGELPGASLKVTDSNGNVMDEWVSTDTPHAVKNLRVNETYTLTEVTAPKGYAIATSIEFKVLNDFKVQTVTMKDKQVFVSKKSVTGEDELPGAKLTVTDAETNKVVDKWTSGKDEHAVENLVVGKEYVLTEVTAPKGYAIATSIKFTVLDDFKVQKVEMLDKQVFVHKTDVTGEAELPNAKLEVINKATKEVVDSWTSGKEEHAIENLVVGETYILRETTAPKGYAVATEIEFTVLDNFKIQKVTMVDKQVFVHKTDVTGEAEIAGAELTVIDKETNKSVDSWTSGTKEHAIENLVVGKTYILREVTAPEGYAVATDIEFTVLDDGKIQTVTMVDQRVKVEKFDEKVKDYLPGAKLEIHDADGKVVDSWVSGKDFHYANNLVVGKTYTLVEVEAPEGYAIATPITFLVEDNKADMTIKMIDKQVITSKVDTIVKQLKGAELEVRDMNGKVVDKWTSDGTPHKIKNLVVGQTYVLVEVKAPEGYAIATPITFKVTDDATNQEFNLINKQVFVSKKDTEGNDMKGAKLSVVAQDGSVVDTWVSDGTAHAVSNISVGATYKLREDEAPEGYVIATDVEFLVQNDFTNQDVVMTDKQLFVSKKDVTGDDELPGATLTVTDVDGNEIDKWVSTDKAHAVKGLRAGVEYILTEVTAPEGYAVAKSIRFTVNDDFAIQTVTMVDKQVTVSKVDITGKEIPGSTLTVTDKETGDVVDEWVSEETPHPIKNIAVGKTYILTEKLAPNGFVKAEDIEFTVEDDFTVQHVEMKDKYVEISKTDIAGDEIEGAELTVTDKETGEVVDKWTSTKESHKVSGLEVGKTYILTEVVAPKDYSIAESIEFTVENDFKAQHVTMKDKQVKISKRDITTGKEIDGAKLTVLDEKGNKIDTWTSKKGKDHYITGLKVGKIYILREETAPDGYVKAEDIKFTVKNDFKVQTVVMKDDYTKVEISKQDITNGKELPGATLVIKDSKGKEIEKWTSTDEAHYIEKLPVGKYVLTEITAPDGYEVAEDVEFEVKETGEIQKVVMKDSPKPTPTTTPKSNIPQTGENVGYLVGAVVVIALAAVVLVLVNRKKKSKKDEKSDK